MPRFSKASAKAPAVAPAAVQPKSLVEVLTQEPIPVSTVDVVGRVVWVFGEQLRYPQCKFAVRSETANGNFLECLVKCNSSPQRMPLVDDVVLLKNVEVRPAWQRPGVGLVERCVIPGLVLKELSCNFNAGKRKRTGSSVEFLGVAEGIVHVYPLLFPLQNQNTKRSYRMSIEQRIVWGSWIHE